MQTTHPLLDTRMDLSFTLLLCTVFSYTLGSVMGAFLISLWYHLPDPWISGSGNPGATNIFRLAGWQPALLTLLWDALKGAFSVILANQLSLGVTETAVVAMAAVLGHMLPVFHQFRGGKGVATVLGCGLILTPYTTLSLAIIWSALAAWKRISSLASLVSALCAPILCWWLNPDYTLLFTFLAVVIIVRHRKNITKLWQGKEGSLP